MPSPIAEPSTSPWLFRTWLPTLVGAAPRAELFEVDALGSTSRVLLEEGRETSIGVMAGVPALPPVVGSNDNADVPFVRVAAVDPVVPVDAPVLVGPGLPLPPVTWVSGLNRSGSVTPGGGGCRALG